MVDELDRLGLLPTKEDHPTSISMVKVIIGTDTGITLMVTSSTREAKSFKLKAETELPEPTTSVLVKKERTRLLISNSRSSTGANSQQSSSQNQRKVNSMKNTVFMFKDNSTLSLRCQLADILK